MTFCHNFQWKNVDSPFKRKKSLNPPKRKFSISEIPFFFGGNPPLKSTEREYLWLNTDKIFFDKAKIQKKFQFSSQRFCFLTFSGEKLRLYGKQEKNEDTPIFHHGNSFHLAFVQTIAAVEPICNSVVNTIMSVM